MDDPTAPCGVVIELSACPITESLAFGAGGPGSVEVGARGAATGRSAEVLDVVAGAAVGVGAAATGAPGLVGAGGGGGGGRSVPGQPVGIGSCPVEPISTSS